MGVQETAFETPHIRRIALHPLDRAVIVALRLARHAAVCSSVRAVCWTLRPVAPWLLREAKQLVSWIRAPNCVLALATPWGLSMKFVKALLLMTWSACEQLRNVARAHATTPHLRANMLGIDIDAAAHTCDVCTHAHPCWLASPQRHGWHWAQGIL